MGRVKQLLKQVIPPTTVERVRAVVGRGHYSGPPDHHRAIFVHIPKNAGNSIEEVYGLPRYVHATYQDYRRASPQKCDAYFKFCFVRNPWDRLYSAYSFIHQKGTPTTERWQDKIDSIHQRYVAGFDDFPSFVHERLDSAAIRQVILLRPQHEFICDETGQNAMDFVGRMETLDQDFAHVCGVLGIKATLPKINASRRSDYRQIYDAEMIDIVARLYAQDIEMFGYQFDG